MMKHFGQILKTVLRRTRLFQWWVEKQAVAVIETAVLFPVMASLLMGVYDLGQGIVVSQKTIAASQIIGDLITRNQAVDVDLVNDIVTAGELALEPYDLTSFGYDIASIRFDEDQDPVVLWRRTENMEPNESAVDSVQGFAQEGEGLVIVTVIFSYTPFFSSFVVDSIDMNEVAFLRGRQSTTVLCADC